MYGDDFDFFLRGQVLSEEQQQKKKTFSCIRMGLMA